MPPTLNMHEAKSQLSKLVESVEAGREAEIIIARNGKPAARLVPIQTLSPRPIGRYDGVYPSMSLEEMDADNEQIAREFYADDLPEDVPPKRNPRARRS
jgi:prevent-host-death family protein